MITAGIDHAGHEDAIRSRIEVGVPPLDGVLEPGVRVADLAEEDVGAGVEHERDAGLVADRPHGGDLGAEPLDREQVVAAVAAGLPC